MSVYGKNNSVVVVGQYFDWVTSGNPPSGYRYINVNNDELRGLLSQTNPFKNGHYVGGGPFISVKVTRSVGGTNAVVWRPNWGKAYSGMFTIGVPDKIGPNLGWAYSQQAYNQLVNQGAVAWNKLRPDKPDFTFATSLYELKDMGPFLQNAVKGIKKGMHEHLSSKGKKTSELSKSGQYFLAIQFGWLPLLSDIRKYVKAQKNGQQRLRQLIRDNGRPIRRSSTWNDFTNHYGGGTSNYNSGSGAALQPTFVTQCYGPGPTYRRVHTNDSTKTWAEGVFRYHLPPGPRDVAWTKKMMRRIMGQRVTPDMIYNIMPWSWLVDYFTDLGTFISNVSPGVGDRLAADYAFVMKTEKWTSNRDGDAHVQGSKTENANLLRPTAASSCTTTRKMRSVASPFGWGIKQSDLSPKQLAILGALGLSKLP